MSSDNTGRLLVATSLLVPLASQVPFQTLGTILGTATDSTGTVIPGSYSIRMESDGFRLHQVSNLRLEVARALTHDAMLEVGALTETVAVEAASPLVETSRGSLAAVVKNKRVLELPLVRREVFDFANTDTRGLNLDGSVISGTCSDLAAFLIGQADRALVQAKPSFGRRSAYIAGFFQDAWRVNGQLTLNLSLRYEYEGPFTEVADRIAGWDPELPRPAAATSGIRHDQTGAFC